MAINPQFKTVNTSISAAACDTQARWENNNPIIPTGILVFESDTAKLKIGINKPYTQTPYHSGGNGTALFTTVMKDLLDNAGRANGVAILDATGKLPASIIPFDTTATIMYKASIAERDAVAIADRNEKLFFVIDATADATVTSGAAATYVWYQSAWQKISEAESIDIDFSKYFNLDTNTIDNIKDGTTHVRMTTGERTKLAAYPLDPSELGGGEAESITPAVLTAAGAVLYTDKIYIKGFNADEMLAFAGTE